MYKSTFLNYIGSITINSLMLAELHDVHNRIYIGIGSTIFFQIFLCCISVSIRISFFYIIVVIIIVYIFTYNFDFRLCNKGNIHIHYCKDFFFCVHHGWQQTTVYISPRITLIIIDNLLVPI